MLSQASLLLQVSLVGFGTFDSKERPAREGRNPQTGDKMQIAGVFPF